MKTEIAYKILGAIGLALSFYAFFKIISAIIEVI